MGVENREATDRPDFERAIQLRELIKRLEKEVKTA